jgi:hypothetical protein
MHGQYILQLVEMITHFGTIEKGEQRLWGDEGRGCLRVSHTLRSDLGKFLSWQSSCILHLSVYAPPNPGQYSYVRVVNARSRNPPGAP